MSVHYLDLTHLDQGVNSCPSFGSFCVQVCSPRMAGGLWSVALRINCLLSICAQDMSLQSSHTDTSLQMLPSPTMQQPQSPNMAHGHLFHQNGPHSSNLGLKVYHSSTFTFSPQEEGDYIFYSIYNLNDRHIIVSYVLKVLENGICVMPLPDFKSLLNKIPFCIPGTW